MRKVSLLCLLGLIATTSTTSMAVAAKSDGSNEVYNEAIIEVVETLGSETSFPNLKKEHFDAEQFVNKITAINTANGKITQADTVKACKESYVKDIDMTDLGAVKKDQEAFCKAFDKAIVAAHEKMRTEKQKLIEQTASFEPVGEARMPIYAPDSAKYKDQSSKYGLFNTKYGYAVYSLDKNGNAMTFVCFLGDDGTENCAKRKACTDSKKPEKDKSLMFVCGDDNDHGSLTKGFSVYQKSVTPLQYSQFLTTVEFQSKQLENVKNMAVKTVEGEQESQKDEKEEKKVAAVAEQEQPECPKGYGYPSEVAAGCAAGICNMDLKQCYPIEQINCFEAAAVGQPANWTGKECNCGNLQDWDPYLAKCVVKQSKRQQLVANGASKERLACYDAGSETKWNGDNKSTDITNCTCVDTAKTWDGKSCVDIAAQQSQLARQKCVDFILSHPGEARLNDQTQSCDCLMQGSVVKVWNGERCEPDASNCNPVVEGATELPVDIDVKYIAKNSSQYLKYQNSAKVYNNSLKQLLATKPELRKAGPCSEMYKRAELEKAFADIQDKDAAIGQMAGQTYNMKYTDGKYKRSASADEAFEDAKYNFAYLIMNGKLADPYNNIKTKSEANALARQAQEYLGSDIKCSGSCGAVGDDRVECVAGSIKMKFRYDTICSQKVKTVSQQGVDNRKPDEDVQEKKPVKTQQYDFQPSYLYKYQGYDKKDA